MLKLKEVGIATAVAPSTSELSTTCVFPGREPPTTHDARTPQRQHPKLSDFRAFAGRPNRTNRHRIAPLWILLIGSRRRQAHLSSLSRRSAPTNNRSITRSPTPHRHP